jgi:heterodisulfide reductase subunit A-like polyferredoxin
MVEDPQGEYILAKDIDYHKIEKVIVDALTDRKKRKTLPAILQDRETDVSEGSAIRAILRHLAYWIHMEYLKTEPKEEKDAQ